MGSIPAEEKNKYDPDFTRQVLASMGPKTSPRLRTVLASLIQHTHDFVRENDVTFDEWMAAVQMVIWAGQMSNDRRNEVQLLCDVIGLESLVDEVTYKTAGSATELATMSAILGPFFRQDAPLRENGSTITFDTPEDGKVAYMHGIVRCASTGKPLPSTEIDVWQASTNGLYEQQDPKQCDHNLRGKFITDSEGRYSFYCLRPTPYPVPNDGPAGKLLELMDRHPYRPAHIHLIVKKPGFEPITTQIFDSGSDYLDNDSVFAVKNGLTVKFEKRSNDPQAEWELEYDVSLAPKA